MPLLPWSISEEQAEAPVPDHDNMENNMRLRDSLIALSVLGLAVGPLAAGSAAAQTEAEPPATMEAPAAAAFDEPTLQSFVVAFLQVDEINRTYMPQMQEAVTPEEQQQIQQQATQEMVTVVENAEGISVEEYNTIIETAQTDPELAQRINDMIRDSVEVQ
jgi:esterase/lipase